MNKPDIERKLWNCNNHLDELLRKKAQLSHQYLAAVHSRRWFLDPALTQSTLLASMVRINHQVSALKAKIYKLEKKLDGNEVDNLMEWFWKEGESIG